MTSGLDDLEMTRDGASSIAHTGLSSTTPNMATVSGSPISMLGTNHGSRLLHLPPELRNEILSLLLVSDGQVEINVPAAARDEITGWPAIADVCKQLREEALPIFFGSKTFYVELHSIVTDALTPWLRKLKQAPLAAKSLIRPVSVHIAAQMMDVQNTDRSTLAMWQVDRSFVPLFDRCDTLLALFADAGLAADQLVWLGMPDRFFRPIPACPPVIWTVFESVRLANKYVLPPLLRKHGLYDEQRPPVDVFHESEERLSRTQLEAWMHTSSRGEKRWKSCTPSRWYQAWVAEKVGLGREEEIADGDSAAQCETRHN